MRSEMKDMRSDIEVLKEDMVNVKADIVLLKSEVYDIRVELRELSEREERHYYMLQNSIGDAFESIKILDRKKLDKEALKKII